MSTAILTIDDVSSANTPALVDYLVMRKIPAVMYAVGCNVERFFDEAVYALKMGMILGNHSYSHIAFSEESLETCIREIEKTEAVLEKVYQAAGVPRLYRPFRFPYGNKGDEGNGSALHRAALQCYLKEKGFSKLIDTQVTAPWYQKESLHIDRDAKWTFDLREYQIRPGSGFTAESVYARIHDAQPKTGDVLLRPGSSHIILMHAHDETEAMVPRYYAHFLDHCMENGVEFIAPSFCEGF